MAAKKPAALHTPPPASSTLPPVADEGAGVEITGTIIDIPHKIGIGVQVGDSGFPPAMPSHLIITSAREGFRRAGRAWSVAPTRIAAAEFTPEQLNALVLEPMLTVTEAD